MDLAAASTPVDLSRLAAPDLVEQLTFDTIVGQLVDAIRAQWPDFDAVLDSDPVMLILQALAYREMLLRADFNDRARQMLLAFAGGASGSFSSLDGVAQLFTSRPILLAGWLHYLAFDLVVGAWEVRDARRRGVAFGWVVPCLAVTFLAGPVGFLVWLLVRAVAGRSGPAVAR